MHPVVRVCIVNEALDAIHSSRLRHSQTPASFSTGRGLASNFTTATRLDRRRWIRDHAAAALGTTSLASARLHSIES